MLRPLRLAQTDSNAAEEARQKAEERARENGTTPTPDNNDNNNNNSNNPGDDNYPHRPQQPDLGGQINDLGGHPTPVTTQERPPIYPTPKPPDLYGPPDNPPPHVPEYPPPPTYGHDEKIVPCCQIIGNVITYPITQDPMEIPKEPEAPRDVAQGAYQVLLHNGAFFQNQQDISVPAVGIAIDFTRHWKGKVEFVDGGLMGYGWDYSYNKRIIAIAHTKLANGLYKETAGVDKAELVYYDGQVDAEHDYEVHSEIRPVKNFDSHFTAYVTTYKSPAGTFHEIERYALLPGQPHPFGTHPNVEPGERIFYVMREKNGTRYVFNCRGQLIYILSRNDSNAQHVRVELQYNGPLNPLTENPMLSLIKDQSGHEFKVGIVKIGEAAIFTNYKCNVVQGKMAIPRIKSVEGAGLSLELHYKNGDTEPILESAEMGSQKWEYSYDGAHRLTEQKNPVEVAKGNGAPYFHNDYDGQGRVVAQKMGGYTTKIDYSGHGAAPPSGGHTVSRNGPRVGGVTVTDPDNAVKQYFLGSAGGYPVVDKLTVHDPKGGLWTTSFEHNGDTQVTRITNPKGNGTSFEYDQSDAEVTLGPIRDWDGHYTYEHDLARGNLIATTLFGKDGSIVAKCAYEQLYNQLTISTDALKNESKRTYRYDVPGERGNPVTYRGPPVAQGKGKAIPATEVVYAYNAYGQEESETRGGNTTGFKYDGHHYVNRIDYPGGAYDTYTKNDRGDIMVQGGTGGTITWERDGRGFPESKTVGPDKLRMVTRYKYDLDNNLTETRQTVADTFGAARLPSGLYAHSSPDRVLTTAYDVLDRKTSETTESGKDKLVTTYHYSPGDHIDEVRAPALDGRTPLVTHYDYDARGLVTDKIEAFGTGAKLRTQTVYDDNGNAIRIVQSGKKDSSSRELTYDGFERIVHVETGIGTDEDYKYDALGNVTHLEITGSTGEGNARGKLAETDSDYDAYHHQISERKNSLTGGIVETKWFYDGDLRLHEQVNPNGGSITYKYDKAGRVEDVTGPGGVKTHNIYDAAGNIETVESTEPGQSIPAGGQYAVAKDAKRTTVTKHDEVGRPISVVSPTENTQMLYDSAGELRATISAAQGATIYDYDGFGRRIETYHNGMSTRTTYTPGGLVSDVKSRLTHESYQYDPAGHTTEHKNELAGTGELFLYDGLGRQTFKVDSDNTSVERTFNDAGLPLTVKVDAAAAKDKFTGFKFEGKLYPAVAGIKSENYTYDGLGRVTRAETNEGSVVTLKYDGLGRVLEESQTIWMRDGRNTQTVKHSYDPSGRWEDTIYPTIAGGVRIRHTLDQLGRTRMVEENGRTIASYLFADAERVSQRTTGVLATRYEYDDALRLTNLTLYKSYGGPNDRTLWSATVRYNQGLPEFIRELSRENDGAPARAMTTNLHYDSDGHVVSSLTEQVTGATTGAQAHGTETGSYSEFENGRLKRSAEFTRDDVAGKLTVARTDSFGYMPDGRVDTLETNGILKQESDATPASLDHVEAAIDHAGKNKIAVNQKFTYDSKGNLLFDGRFIYDYDYMSRVDGVRDTWAPFRYNERVYFSYDAFGRRINVWPQRDRVPQGMITWGGGWDKQKQGFFYDGGRLIAEVVSDEEKKGQTTLLARYVFGARSDERVFMERRPEHNLEGQLEGFYFQEDTQGTIRLLADEVGNPHYVSNREPQAGTEEAGPGRPPGDEMYLTDLDIRVPYLTAATRIDGFAGSIYDENTHNTQFNYKAAYEYNYKVDRTYLKASIAELQDRRWTVVAAMLAVHLVAPYATAAILATGASQLTASVIAMSALNVGVGYAQASYFHDDFGAAEIVKSIGTSVVGGVAGGFANSSMGFVQGQIVNFGVTTAAGTLLDVGVSGRSWSDSFVDNAASSAMGAALGGLMGELRPGESVPSELTAASEQINELPSAGEPTATASAARPAGSATEVFELALGAGDVLFDGERLLGRNTDAEGMLLDTRIITEMRFGSRYSAYLAWLIESGTLKVKIYEFGDEVVNLFKGDQNARTYRGFYDPSEPDVLHINLAATSAKINGRWNARALASVIVHEGTHQMGLGELSAHVAEAQFLVARSPIIRGLKYGIPIDATNAPELSNGQHEIINAYRWGSVQDMEAYLGRCGYTFDQLAVRYRVDSFVDRFPLRTGVPGFDQYMMPLPDGSRM